ncbi:response regulator [Pseudomonas sp. CFBP 8770]|uniref:response regulator n=1 Tax=unclassified Pseudomonas TaxID=196821 RepID=UPI001787672A|nr:MULTISPECIES: response regulator [unclassified Pseudomonas]MBD8472558.1 response regulator [Pseudomonas sp. CFBP 8773]MBD8649347.1 response regulator [Pseudomonas sp. CFBP 8770]
MSIPTSERVLVLAPLGRDSQVALQILSQAGIPGTAVSDVDDLCAQLQREGAGMCIVANEALSEARMQPLLVYLSQQPAWSDLPIVLMTHQRAADQAQSMLLAARLGNVTFVERPFHPLTLISLAKTAIRGRRRQYEARDRLLDLSESEQRLQHAMSAGRLGAWELTCNPLQLNCSDRTRTHYGIEASTRFEYSDWLLCVHPSDQAMMQEALINSLQLGADFALQFRNIWPDGSVHWIDMRARAIPDKQGRIQAMVGVTTDITEQKAAEQQLRELNGNLEQQVEERTAQVRINEEALRQAQKMEAVGQLTGGIAHDFNNMLTGIIGSLELMRRRLSRSQLDDLPKLIDLGISSANRAASLTHRLLAFSRRQSLDSKPVQVNGLVHSMEELLHRSLNESIALHLRLDPQLWIAEADPHQLESALLNLVINARDAMPGVGEVIVETANRHLDESFTSAQQNLEPGDYIMLSVSDTGLGMDQAVINRAFDPFFTTKPIGQGTGLGLSMIYGFSKQSRGHVAIQSTPGLGTTVQLYLPRCYASQLPQANVPVIESPMATNGETVLIVEDDHAVRSLVCEVLRELGYCYLEAADANAAQPILASGQRIDLLISDVGLPGMNGRQLAEVARHLRPGLKVLFITGYAQHAEVRAGFLDDGMQMITKPFAFDVLTAKVREMSQA